MSATVATVLRSGGEYTPEHAWRLAADVEEHLPGAAFVCLSDLWREVPGGVPLGVRWAGWWSKMELFAPALFTGTVLYLDLDTVVLSDLDEMAGYAGERAVLRDFHRTGDEIGTGVMLWRGDAMRSVWDAFVDDPETAMREHPLRMDHFIEKHLGPADRVQDVFPGQVVSWKCHCQQGVPLGARIIAFHGRPRPWETDLWAA